MAEEAGDGPWRRDEPQSPCRRVCVLEPASGLCIGCLRTEEEIAAWPAMAPAARRALMAQLPARRPLLARRRGGRAGRLGTSRAGGDGA